MSCYPTAAGQTDVVFQVVWQCSGYQSYQGQNPAVSVNGVVGVTYTAGSPYTPYSQLTESQVLGWVWASGVNKSATETNVAAQLAYTINNPVIEPPLPWE